MCAARSVDLNWTLTQYWMFHLQDRCNVCNNILTLKPRSNYVSRAHHEKHFIHKLFYSLDPAFEIQKKIPVHCQLVSESTINSVFPNSTKYPVISFIFNIL